MIMRKILVYICSITIAMAVLASCNKKPVKGVEEAATTEQLATDELPSDATTADIKSVNNLEGPAMLDFYATWCGPCKMMTPIVEEMEKKYGKTIKFQSIDIDKNQSMAVDFQVNAVPTFFFVSKKGEVRRVEGAMTATEFENNLEWVEAN